MLYSYRAVDKSGKSISGEREAASERELAEVLRHQGYLLLEAEAPQPAVKFWRGPASFSQIFLRVSLVERMVFARNLAVMIGAGLALARALEALREQSANHKFRQIIASLHDGIVAGKTLAESLKPYERIFGALFVNMVESGEISGKLEYVLKILARQMKRDHDLRSKVQGAMLYPAIIVALLIAIGIFMMVYVVPTLTATFKELNIELPLTTRLIISSSAFLLAYYGYVVLAVLVGIVAAARWLRSPAGKSIFDAFILRVPIFGTLVRKLNSARFARTLSSLIASGIPITRALEVTAEVLGNTHFRSSLRAAATAIQQGKPLNQILAVHPDIFPPMVTQMIQVGEETGTLTRMLLRLAIFYEEEVTNTTKNLASIIEPLLMIVVGGVVGFFAVAMIQPIYSGLGNL